jgi:hypothetical protein
VDKNYMIFIEIGDVGRKRRQMRKERKGGTSERRKVISFLQV